MITFILAALALLAVTAFLLLPPLLRSRERNTSTQASLNEQQEANLAILRTQLAELESEQQQGQIQPEDFQQAREELQRRILEESAAATAAAGAEGDQRPSRSLAIGLLVLLALSGSLGYAWLGTPLALNPEQVQARPDAQAMSPEQIAEMVNQLAARMEENPDDEQGWVMLARSYKVMGRLEDAARAYARAEKLVGTDPSLLADYAEALAMSSGSGMKGKPAALVDQALKLDPGHGHALFLAGAAAMEAGKRQQAADYWEKVLPQVEPGSELHKLLSANIEKIRSEKGASAGKP
ncbi:c-type cytochrome biogenesis protein CcmI [Azovibrio restrictus]|uniref:c-type cytochrome biogenesis protein CcmI n=1 Tax=Azovibrio restrictus TaxID=146938 RepID=UPI0026F1E348|nr:c-type cytochrome biogenesis protein CcmI [Azovibrio restrictus]